MKIFYLIALILLYVNIAYAEQKTTSETEHVVYKIKEDPNLVPCPTYESKSVNCFHTKEVITEVVRESKGVISEITEEDKHQAVKPELKKK